MENQKTVHATRGKKKRVAECIDKRPVHGKRMSSKQAMDIHGSGACTRPKHYQLVPSKYKSSGRAVRRRESLF